MKIIQQWGTLEKIIIQQKQSVSAFSKDTLVVNFLISKFVYYYSISILNVCNILSSYKKQEHFYFENLENSGKYRGSEKQLYVQYLTFCSISLYSFPITRIVSCLFLSATCSREVYFEMSYFIVTRTVIEFLLRKQLDESAKGTWEEHI